METVKRITGNSPDDIWQQVAADFAGGEMLDYAAIIQQPGQPDILLETELDMGGGFEGGYEWTRLSTPLSVQDDFRFALHHETFLDKAGKFLGLEDKVIGYEDFDKEFIIKTNDEQKVKAAFADVSVRSFFRSLSNFTFHIERPEDAGATLVLEINRAINAVAELRPLYEAFACVALPLNEGEKVVGSNTTA